MMNSKQLPQISIVTPSYNSKKYIEDCIQSVLNQQYDNYEHIIIDGGSTDGTIEILKKYTHLKWISEPDEGQSDALNKGFSMATGDIIGWCNSDDIYLLNTFEKVVLLLEDTKSDGVYSNLYLGDDKLNITGKYKSHKSVKWLSLFHCFIPSATFFFKRKIIDNGVTIDKIKQITMDKDFFASILYSGYRMKYVNDYFAIFRWHGANKSLDNIFNNHIRFREGLNIYNKNALIKVKETDIFINLYSLLIKIAVIPRFIFRLFS